MQDAYQKVTASGLVFVFQTRPEFYHVVGYQRSASQGDRHRHAPSSRQNLARYAEDPELLKLSNMYHVVP